MPEVYAYLTGMEPSRMLDLLVQFVEAYPNHRPILKHITISKQQNLATQVTLRLPVTVGFWGAKLRQRRSERAFCQFYETVIKERVQRSPGSANDKNYLSLASGLFSLLHTDETYEPLEKQGYLETEKLLVGINLSIEQATEIFNRLREFATHVRPAIARANGQTYSLFHALDSVDRFSTLQGELVSGGFENCRALDCYQTQPFNTTTIYKLFLPKGFNLQKEHMAHVARLIMAAPEIFGASINTTPRHNLLGFLDQDNADQPYDSDRSNQNDRRGRFLFTANVNFLHEAEVGRDYAFKQYDLLALDNVNEALDTLRSELERQNKDGLGYKVEMHHSRYSEFRDHKREYDRILQEIENLQERKADLESYSNERPRLLRFTQEQLPRLVDVLRVVPPNKLNGVKYAFENHALLNNSSVANKETHNQGVHFLYIDPKVRIDFLTPMLEEASADTPIEFWLDPTWARYYLNQANEALVFVPKSRMLYPAMHSWDTGKNEMDNYLRLMLAKSIQVPDKPLYIFDVDRYSDCEIAISVLDREKFAPLNSPKYIGWINDNLLMLERYQKLYPAAANLETLIRTLANDSRRETFAHMSHDQMTQADAAYRTAAETASSKMAVVTDDLVSAMDLEFNSIIESGKDFIVKAQALNKRLKDIEALHATIVSQATTTEAAIRDTEKANQGVDSRVTRLKDDVKSRIENALKTTSQAQTDIDKRVEELQKQYDELNQKIDQLKRVR